MKSFRDWLAENAPDVVNGAKPAVNVPGTNPIMDKKKLATAVHDTMQSPNFTSLVGNRPQNPRQFQQKVVGLAQQNLAKDQPVGANPSSVTSMDVAKGVMGKFKDMPDVGADTV